MCKFKYDAPSNLEVGQEMVVPIWVGSTRQGFAGQTKTFDFRLRVSPAGGGTSSARSFEARFVHQPFLSGRMFLWSILVAIVAAIVGMLFVIGFSSVGRAATAIKCGFDDDHQEFPEGPVLIKERCDGAPTTLQKGFFSNPDDNGGSGSGTTGTGTPGAGTPGARTSQTPAANVTGTPGAGGGTGTGTGGDCKGDPALNNFVGKPVTVLQDALIRATPGTSGQIIGRGLNRAAGISGGPQCVDNLVWWEIDISGTKGWTAEQDQNKVRLLLER
jgi:hypothetical protein